MSQQRYLSGGARPHLAIVRNPRNDAPQPVPIAAEEGPRWRPFYDRNGKFCFKQSVSNPNLIHFVDTNRKIDQIFDLGRGEAEEE